MMEIAEKSGIRIQLEVLEGGTTDAAAIQLAQAGIPSAAISIPSRYVHSFSEVISKNDIEESIKLLVRLMEEKIPV